MNDPRPFPRRRLDRVDLARVVLAMTTGCQRSTVAPHTTAAVRAVVVTPGTATIAVGQSQPLVATPVDSGGNPLSGRPITWSSRTPAVATVTPAGLVTAVAVGSDTVTATSEGRTGAVAITVTPAGGGGMILFQENFADNAFASRGWYDNTAMAITDTELVSVYTHALEIHFTTGATHPTWGGAARHAFTPTSMVYLSFWVKYSANWVGSGQPFHPHEFYFLTTEEAPYAGLAFDHLTAYVEDNYQNGGVPVLIAQDGLNIDQTQIGVDLTNVTENRAVAGCNGNTDGYPTGCYNLGTGQYDNGKAWTAAQPAFLPNPGPGYKGYWHFVEAYFQLNSIQNGKGVSDGIARYWVDGQLVIDHTNVLLRTGAHPTMQFNQFIVAPDIGTGSPVDQTMWVDALTIATGKP